MTVLGAYQGEGCVVLASDSRVTEEDGSIRPGHTVKLWFLDDSPIAWGFSGDEDVGLPFTDWMKAHPWPKPLEWSVLLAQSSRKLHSLNAGVQQGQRTEVLLVAFLDAKPHVVHLFRTLLEPAHEEHGASLWFVGRGAGRSFDKLRATAREMSSFEVFRLAMEHALSAEMCGGPLQAVRVSAAGVWPVDGFESDTRNVEGS